MVQFNFCINTKCINILYVGAALTENQKSCAPTAAGAHCRSNRCLGQGRRLLPRGALVNVWRYCGFSQSEECRQIRNH